MFSLPHLPFSQRILVQYCISIPVHVPFPIRRFRQQIHQLLALLCLLSVGRNARIPICSYERRNIRFVRKYERRQDPRTCPDYCNDTSIVDTVFNIDTRFRMQSKWALCIRQWVGTVVATCGGSGVFKVEKNPTDDSKLVLTINRQPIEEWFKEQWEKFRRGLRQSTEEPRKSRGLKL